MDYFDTIRTVLLEIKYSYQSTKNTGYYNSVLHSVQSPSESRSRYNGLLRTIVKIEV